MALGSDIKRSLQAAGLSPRCLASVTQVHFTTIYYIIRNDGKSAPHPLVEGKIRYVLDKLDEFVEKGYFPIKGASNKEKTARIKELIEDAES